jgi:hypothetical protein
MIYQGTLFDSIGSVVAQSWGSFYDDSFDFPWPACGYI